MPWKETRTLSELFLDCDLGVLFTSRSKWSATVRLDRLGLRAFEGSATAHVAICSSNSLLLDCLAPAVSLAAGSMPLPSEHPVGSLGLARVVAAFRLSLSQVPRSVCRAANEVANPFSLTLQCCYVGIMAKPVGSLLGWWARLPVHRSTLTSKDNSSVRPLFVCCVPMRLAHLATVVCCSTCGSTRPLLPMVVLRRFGRILLPVHGLPRRFG